LDTLLPSVESLKKCPEAKFSDLVIVSDWAGSEKDIPNVLAVRNYIKTIDGFNSIRIIERETNLGVDYNLIKGIKDMADEFEQFIVFEDDLKVTPDFLKYLNFSLNFYKDNSEVLNVSAFNFVTKIPLEYKYDAYFAKRFWPWGWATWSDKIKNVDWEVSDREEFLKSKSIQKAFNEWGSDRSRMLTQVLTGVIRTWDIRLDYYQFKTNQVTVFPRATLVENLGFQGEGGTHTFVYNRYKTKTKLKLNNVPIMPENISIDHEIRRNFIWKNSFYMRIFTRIMRYSGYKN
jgi:hypothetical protein